MEVRWDILGHEKAKKYMENSLISKNLHHCYILLGPKGVGKEKFARLCVKSFLCSSEKSYIPCGLCIHCKYFDQGAHPDFFKIFLSLSEQGERKKNISIEQIKEVQRNLSVRPLLSNYKGVIIDSAESFSEKASNALLKTLEEPTENTIIFLITTSLRTILPTIQSRSYVIHFYSIDNNLIYEDLLTKGATRDQARLFSSLSCGIPSIAIEFFNDSKKYDEYKSSFFQCLEYITLPAYKKIIVCQKIFQKKKNFVESGDTARLLLDIWLKAIRDIMYMKLSNDTTLSNVFALEEIKPLSEKMSTKKIANIFNSIIKAKKLITENTNPTIVYENFLLQL